MRRGIASQYGLQGSGKNPWILAQYRTKHDLTEEALAEQLGCTVETLRYLCLCRRPEGPKLEQQLLAIAERFPVSAEKLDAILREVSG
ncbi:hypothetical protein ATI61_10996 [Archangium gephyra]|uniref:Uncharacterized protein n=1 Tax=Archangium gephyra TaxID=48 RepID=A0AAC8Q2H9_9BACT|nr:hypothetical protein [Archangium gephyra]AKI99713.1 Hypothetical protein AA314_01340 [Archangium gephyra]REG27759.1 hypothetical protein ATI61_10996 [Archangium gephyra]